MRKLGWLGFVLIGAVCAQEAGAQEDPVAVPDGLAPAGLVSRVEADYDAAIEKWRDGDFSELSKIEDCAVILNRCLAIKASGLLWGEGWDEDIEAAVPMLKKAAEAGSAHAMTDLYYYYDDPAMRGADPMLAAYWAGMAALSAPEGIERELSIADFFYQDFEQARLFERWREVRPGTPRSREWTGMGYRLGDKPPAPTDEIANDLSRARMAFASGSMTGYDVFMVMKYTEMDYTDAMRLYGNMLLKHFRV